MDELKVRKAAAAVQAARVALAKASAEFLAALEATDEEVNEAAESVRDMLNDDRIDDAVGSAWYAMLAEQTLLDREYVEDN
jgi:hypothetical protein